jgi:predicted DNA-binding ribbon-helix-helix protein
MEKRFVVIAGRRMLVRLEKEFWDCLEDIAAEQGARLPCLVEDVGRQHPEDVSSALRVHVLAHVLQQAGSHELTIDRDACDPFQNYN